MFGVSSVCLVCLECSVCLDVVFKDFLYSKIHAWSNYGQH